MALNLLDLTSNANNLTNHSATDITSSLPASFPTANHAAQVVAASTQYLSAADANQLSISTTSKMTWEFWFKCQALLDNNYAVWKGASSNFEYQIVPGTAAGGLTCTTFASGGGARYTQTSADSVIATGTWYHIAVTVDDTLAWAYTNLNIYIDETNVNGTHAGASSNTLSNGTAPLDIGVRPDTSGYGSFQIMDLRIWNTIRTTTQLTNNKNNFLVGNESGLVAYYPFGTAPLPAGGFFLAAMM